jgi:hypothetical protein
MTCGLNFRLPLPAQRSQPRPRHTINTSESTAATALLQQQPQLRPLTVSSPSGVFFLFSFFLSAYFFVWATSTHWQLRRPQWRPRLRLRIPLPLSSISLRVAWNIRRSRNSDASFGPLVSSLFLFISCSKVLIITTKFYYSRDGSEYLAFTKFGPNDTSVTVSFGSLVSYISFFSCSTLLIIITELY